MMAQTKYKIGQFSRLGRVTVRTLRHYEKIGLLKPGIVDMWTGYRYYGADQLQKLLPEPGYCFTVEKSDGSIPVWRLNRFTKYDGSLLFCQGQTSLYLH